MANHQLDDTDRKLIALLAQNARMSVAHLARKLDIARTTVQTRLERLEARGVIAGYTVRLGQDMRAPLHATALVSIEPRAGPAVLGRLTTLDQVERVHTTSGRFDLLVQIRAESTEELDETLDRIGEIKGVNRSESLIHLSTKIDRAP